MTTQPTKLTPEQYYNHLLAIGIPKNEVLCIITNLYGEKVTHTKLEQNGHNIHQMALK